MDQKTLFEKMGREWEELKGVLNTKFDDEVKKYGTALGETKALIEGYNARLDKLELDIKRAAMAPAKDQGDRNEKVAAFLKFARKGDGGLSPDERKLLVVSDDSTGGYGAPSEFSSEIIKGVIEISPMRSLVRVRSTSNRSVKTMKRTGTFAAVWVSESGTRAETTGLKYGLEEIPTHELYALVDVSQQDLEDTEFNLESELRSEFSEQFGLAEAQSVVDGNGDGKPEGILTNAAIAVDNTAAGGALTYDSLVDVSHNGKGPYLANARFIFNLRTLGAIRKMKDSQNNPIWAPMVAGAPATILGFPYEIVQGMPNIAATATPVAFGDFKRGYQLVDRVTISVLRDIYTQSTVGAVRFLARKRLGGQVVLAEAIRKIRVTA